MDPLSAQTLPSLEQLMDSLGFFKDWTNYLLVTTVAALGWVAKKDVVLSGATLRWTVALLCLSIVFAILTLALVPLVGQELRAGGSIYDAKPTFRVLWLWGPDTGAKLKWVCWPQHVCFLAAVVAFSIGTIRQRKQ